MACAKTKWKDQTLLSQGAGTVAEETRKGLSEELVLFSGTENSFPERMSWKLAAKGFLDEACAAGGSPMLAA